MKARSALPVVKRRCEPRIERKWDAKVIPPGVEILETRSPGSGATPLAMSDRNEAPAVRMTCTFHECRWLCLSVSRVVRVNHP